MFSVLTFFLWDMNAAAFLPNSHLPELHQDRVRNEADAPSKATLSSRLVKVIYWITLQAPVALISGFHVRDFWCPQTLKAIEDCRLPRLAIWEIFFRLLPLFQALDVSLIHIMRSLWVLVLAIPKSSAGRNKKHQKYIELSPTVPSDQFAVSNS